MKEYFSFLSPKSLITLCISALFVNTIKSFISGFSLLLQLVLTLSVVILYAIGIVIKRSIKRYRDLADELRECHEQLAAGKQINKELQDKIQLLNRSIVLQHALTSFIEASEILESAQLYHYTKNKDIKPDDIFVKIVVSFKASAAKKDVEINSILQSSFVFETTLFNEINDFFKQFNEYYGQREKKRDVFIEATLGTYNVSLIKKLTESLNNIQSISDIHPFHYSYYRILMVLHSIYNKNNSISIESLLKDVNIENQLLLGKKTGLLGTIFMDNMYCFNNRRSLLKKDRIYITFPVNIKNENYIALISVSQDGFRGGIEDIEREVYSLFYKRIKEVFENS